MLARGDKDDEFGTDDDEYLSQMTSNEDVSQKSLISPKDPIAITSALTSPGANLDQELEKLLLEEAKKQGIYDVDAVIHKTKL